MDIQIENFRGIHEAHIACHGITLIAGENAAGKTRIAQAAASALTGNPIPVSGVKKNTTNLFVHSGSAQGRITMANSKGLSVFSWPTFSFQTEGDAPKASNIAAGLESIVNESRISDRVRILAPYLFSDPTEDDLANALPGIVAQEISEIWDSIRTDGWKYAYEEARTKCSELKGRWFQVSGESYIAKKAASWFPEDWEEGLHCNTEKSLVNALNKNRTALEVAISKKAVGEVELASLRQAAAMKINLSALEESFKQGEQHYRQAVHARNALPPAEDQHNQSHSACPHCSSPVTITQRIPGGFILHKVAKLDKKEAKSCDSATLNADREVGRAQEALWEAKRSLEDGKRQAREIENIKKKLKKIENSKDHLFSEQIENCREQLHLAETRLAAFRIKKEADRLCASIESSKKVINILSLEGIRARKLAEAVHTFNQTILLPLCQLAQWPAVTLNEDLLPSLGGRLFPLLSESEQFRVRVTLQVAMAKMDRSDALIIDRADILDRAGRNGLIRMLSQIGIPSLVCMTIANPEKTPPPNLADLGKGTTYWVANGTVTPLNQVTKAA
ncbi:MAG: hypothetical protein HQL77_17835 [Magnetococcales bacterium]|nr:hypothetical protein [Magnetococcales bacterium]